MEDAFFYCHNLGMDTVKLIDMLLDDEELRDIPMEHIFRVAYEFLVILSSGQCLYAVDKEDE